MRGFLVVVAVCGLLMPVAGCKSTAYTAPVVERGKGRKARAAPPAVERHVVQPGDTLYQIAFEHGLDYRDVARWNGIPNPDLLRIGAVLRLRPPPEAAGTTSRVSAGPQEPAVPETNPESWIWPVRGKLIAAFNEAEGRKGIDIAVPLGTAIQAGAAGRVVYAGQGLRGYGKLTIIRHSKSLLSAYAHQSRVLVKEGDQVVQGQKIGEVGDTDAERSKLHFEIREYGRPVNPDEYLPS